MKEQIKGLDLLTKLGLKLVTGDLDGIDPNLVISAINTDPHMLPLTRDELGEVFRFRLAVGLCQRRRFSRIWQTLSLAN